MRVLALFAVVVLLAACGQAGDLYLPDQKPGQAQPPPASPNPEPAKKGK